MSKHLMKGLEKKKKRKEKEERKERFFVETFLPQ